mmetsp:Transcript_1908/g.4192  ORF Transcript_1908/g.4192 Transcript_1908/m.4192 type:complete len:1185 (+) Transcript_1908:106-3660(+)
MLPSRHSGRIRRGSVPASGGSIHYSKRSAPRWSLMVLLASVTFSLMVVGCHAFDTGIRTSSNRYGRPSAAVVVPSSSRVRSFSRLATIRYQSKRNSHAKENEEEEENNNESPSSDDQQPLTPQSASSDIQDAASTSVCTAGKDDGTAVVGRKRRFVGKVLLSCARLTFRAVNGAVRYGAQKIVNSFEDDGAASPVSGMSRSGNVAAIEGMVEPAAPSGDGTSISPPAPPPPILADGDGESSSGSGSSGPKGLAADANVVGMSSTATEHSNPKGSSLGGTDDSTCSDSSNYNATLPEIHEIPLDPTLVRKVASDASSDSSGDGVEGEVSVSVSADADGAIDSGDDAVEKVEEEESNTSDDAKTDNGTDVKVNATAAESGPVEADATSTTNGTKDDENISPVRAERFVFPRLRLFGWRKKDANTEDEGVIDSREGAESDSTTTGVATEVSRINEANESNEQEIQIDLVLDSNTDMDAEVTSEDLVEEEEEEEVAHPEDSRKIGEASIADLTVSEGIAPHNNDTTQAIIVNANKRRKLTKIISGASRRSKLIVLFLVCAVSFPYLEITEDEAGGVTGVAVAGLPRRDELLDGARDVAARGAEGGRKGLANALAAAGRARDAWNSRSLGDVSGELVEVDMPSADDVSKAEEQEESQSHSMDLSPSVDMDVKDAAEVMKADENLGGVEQSQAAMTTEADGSSAASEEAADKEANGIESKGSQSEQDSGSKKKKEKKDGWAAEEALKNALAAKELVGGSSTVAVPAQPAQPEVEMSQVNAMSSVASAVQKVGPSTVRVDTETEIERAVHIGPRIDAQGEHSAEEYDDEVLGGVPSPMKPERWKTIQQGQGSGIIFSEDGLCVTNAHVIEGATRVYVTLTDGRRFRAEVKGTDEIVDIAVLKIIRNDESSNKSKKQTSSPVPNNFNGNPLPVAELADSDSLEVGQFVIAIGSPGGLDNTVTMGILSGLKRSSEEVGLYDKKVEFIQTDAAINMGNSGGPLVDVATGDVIGINTCMRYNMEGTSFAVPINKVKGIMHDLAEGKQISHGYVGIYTSSLTPDLAKEKNADPNSNYGVIAETNGVIVLTVYPGTPAEEAGLRRADVITEIGGKKVEKAADAYRIIDGAKIGSPLDFKVMRGEKEVRIKIKPEEFATRLRIAKEQREKRLKEKMNRLKDELQQSDSIPPAMQEKEH